MAFTYSKDERLYHKKLIAQLFEKGNRSISRFPFRFTWVEIKEERQEPFPVQAMFIVSKRNFPKASSRNRIKRQMRELYRVRKGELYEALGGTKHIALSCSYVSKTELNYAELSSTFLQLFDQLKNEMAKDASAPIHRADKNI